MMVLRHGSARRAASARSWVAAGVAGIRYVIPAAGPEPWPRGYVVKEKDGRRNRYRIQAHLPLPEPTARERTVGEVLALLTGADPTVT